MYKLAKQAHVLSTFIELNVKARVVKVPPKPLGKWLANRLQYLGPTYIKIGQFISSRSDIFGEEFTEQFFDLRDQVTPIPGEEVKPLITSLLSKHSFIKEIDEHPLASASIGQVHMAKDAKGNDLLIKLKRPNIKAIIEGDLDFLRFLFSLASAASVENMTPTMTMLNEFEAFLGQEVSFHKEHENLVRFYSMYMPEFGSKFLRVPRVVRLPSDDDVLIMEYVHNHGCFEAYSGDKSELAKDLMRFFIRQLVQYGFLHGDPHKGNIGITDDNKLVLYDFGNIITIDENERNLLKELIYMLIIGNKYGIVKVLDKLGVVITDKHAVYEYIERYIEYMRTIDIKVFEGLHTPSDQLPIHLNGKIIRILRVYGILEGICKELDPTFNYFKLLDDKVMDLALDATFLDYKIRKDMSMLNKFQNVVFKLMDEEN